MGFLGFATEAAALWFVHGQEFLEAVQTREMPVVGGKAPAAVAAQGLMRETISLEELRDTPACSANIGHFATALRTLAHQRDSLFTAGAEGEQGEPLREWESSVFSGAEMWQGSAAPCSR